MLLSVLVFVHEGGHFLAARACGVRVLEFFLGMPCRFNIHHVSKRIGTKFGVTPDSSRRGYAEICGMDPTDVPCAPQVLACIHRHAYGLSLRDRCRAQLGLSVR
ncbi:MAG: site-2 protease family protein [Collinsella sp.]